MAKIKVLDFAKNVEYNRKRLVSFLNNNGEGISENVSLSKVVDTAISSNITESANKQAHRVRWFQPDGEIVKEEWVKTGSSATIPESPIFDDTYLEFVEWVHPASIENITRNVDCGAVYRVRADEQGRRWTHLFMDLNSDTLFLQFKIIISSDTVAGTLWVDWGDGATEEFNNQTTTSISVEHTYSEEGQYLIKMYCNYNMWSIVPQSYGLLQSSAHSTRIKKLYWGDNIKVTSFSSSYGGGSPLQVLIFPSTENDLPSRGLYQFIGNTLIIPKNIHLTNNVLYANGSLRTVILPNDAPQPSGELFNNASKNSVVQDCVIPDSWTIIRASFMSGQMALSSIEIPKNIKTVKSNAFKDCPALTKIIFEEKSDGVTLEAQINGSGDSTRALEYVKLPDYIVEMKPNSISGLGIKEFVLPSNFNHSITISSPNLTKSCIYDIVMRLKDNTGEDPKTLFVAYTVYQYMRNTFVNLFGEIVSKGEDGVESLLDILINKNWTVSSEN